MIMAEVPNFGALARSFPYKPKALTPDRTGAIPAGATIATNKELVEQIGGDLHKRLAAIYRDLDRMNTCAVRLSYCLNKAGSKVTRMSSIRMFKGADDNYYTISADEMITYLKAKYGKPVLIFDGQKSSDKEWLGAVTPPAQGIFGYDWQGRIADFGATGHVDIGKLPDSNVANITEIGTGAYFEDGAMKVFFWKSAAA
jgi:hypothetical protein